MLEGLEAVEVELKNVISSDLSMRLDSEYYKKIFVLEDAKLCSLNAKPLSSFTKKIDVGFVGSMVSNYSEDDSDPVLLQTNNIGEFFIQDINPQRINRQFHQKLTKSQVEKKNVLLARSGSFGKASIYLKDEVSNSSDIIIVETDDTKLNPYYLVVFLNSKLGKNQLYRFASGGLQGHVNLTILETLKVPCISVELSSMIEQVVLSAHKSIENSQKLYSEAEKILLEELGLQDWKPEERATTVKSLSDFLVSGRLDAEYYQPKYDDLFAHLKKYETKQLSQIATINKSIEPGSDAYQESGIPFARVSNLSKFGLTEPDIHLDRAIFETNELKPKKDTILLSKDGSVGIAYKLEQDLDAVTSGAILHLKITDKEFLPDYLTLVLNSIIVKMQAERDAGGSIIQHWKPSEIEQVIIPKLSRELQTQIAQKIQESFALKAESKRLLDLAKTAVETAIEHGEQKAIELLNL
ncbi:restriction endonuclease subunit S [Bacteroides sp.]|uniref:restriction endonuclease subunit S n=1 Tax=Bacteroides sp. TaxID=29523 RepID=UPI00261B8951|nr:restriction endonuclease subunit S [Bacteroides sp.]